MNFYEARLSGVQTDESCLEALLSIIDKEGSRFTLRLEGLERLLVDEFRQQNVIEEVRHWTRTYSADLRASAFLLLTGISENKCSQQLSATVDAVLDRVARGELEILEVSAIFGAQVLASFKSLTVIREKK
jgi:hypothetical protein